YSDKCTFAHSDAELKPRQLPANYKSRHCNKYDFGQGHCPYGAKCNFIHEDRKRRSMPVSPTAMATPAVDLSPWPLVPNTPLTTRLPTAYSLASDAARADLFASPPGLPGTAYGPVGGFPSIAAGPRMGVAPPGLPTPAKRYRSPFSLELGLPTPRLRSASYDGLGATSALHLGSDLWRPDAARPTWPPAGGLESSLGRLSTSAESPPKVSILERVRPLMATAEQGTLESWCYSAGRAPTSPPQGPTDGMKSLPSPTSPFAFDLQLAGWRPNATDPTSYGWHDAGRPVQ
ncbi:hypothetical protein IWQ60_012537, partial [Tieghemiomyces parasiticus]